MTESKIQKVLTDRYVDNGPHYLALENIYFYNHESDLLTVDISDFTYEYEIKSTKPDFRNDFKKSAKHEHLKRLDNLSVIPNFFYYVCERDLISINNIPEYAGLIYIYEYRMKRYPKVIKKAPILHSEKIQPEKWREIVIKMYRRSK